MDLSKTIKINKRYEISYGKLLITSLITLFNILMIIGLNDWQFTPTIFGTLSVMLLSLSKSSESEEIREIEEKINKNQELIEKQEEQISILKEKMRCILNE